MGQFVGWLLGVFIAALLIFIGVAGITGGIIAGNIIPWVFAAIAFIFYIFIYVMLYWNAWISIPISGLGTSRSSSAIA